jgi:SAM-dependent methyltransferase/GT2 family glycosyltransferase
VKDPRSSLLVPLWRAVAGRVGVPLRILHVHRDANAVAESLAARNGMPRDVAVGIWSDHQRNIDRDSQGLDRRTFHHDALMRDPRATFAAMGEFCGLADAAGRAADAAALVDPSLWHHRAGEGGDADASTQSVDPQEPPDRGRVLVVMRTRWRLHLLPRAVRSVLSQTYPHWFLQIVNDGGPPHLVEGEIAAYRHLLGDRLGLLHLPSQHGMEAASNAGIAARPSEFIAMHDDDDAWSPDFLERMVAHLHATGGRAAVCRTRIVRERWDGSDYVREQVEEFGPEKPSVSAEDLAVGNQFPPISLVFRRSLYDEVGGFHEGLPALGDWHFNRRIAALGLIDVVPQSLAFWHLRDASDMAANSPRIAHAWMDAFVRAWPEASPLPDFFPQARPVRFVCDDTGLDGFPRMPIASLPSGLYLVRTGGEPAALIVNATRPIVNLDIDPAWGVPGPSCGTAEAVRLGDAIERLDDFAGPPRLPDVLCIGGQRAGTTWLHAALQRHPQVWACGIKEFHQFDWDGRDPVLGGFRQRQALAVLRATAACGPDRERQVRMLLRHAFPPTHSWENYAATFAAAPRDQVACDFTPSYATLDDRAVAEIVQVMPEIKVIFLLRDPVARAVSGGLHDLYCAGIAQPTGSQLRDACEATSNVLRTDMLRTLDTWQRHLPEGRLLVLFHDAIASDPVDLIRTTCEFLGIDASASMVSHAALEGLPRNPGRSRVPWPELARVKEDLSRRWLPMLVELERRFGGPAGAWRMAAEARLRASEAVRAGAGAGRDNTVIDNLAQWDVRDAWDRDGDEWDGQARSCGIGYEAWKAGMIARYEPFFPRGGTLLEIGPGHGRWSRWLVERAGLLVLCDVSPNCLDACRGRLAGMGRFRGHLSHAADLPADLTGAVDAVWSYDCFVHIAPAECERYLAEIARVLRPGGVAVIHHADRRTGFLEHVADWWRRAVRRDSDPAGESGWRSKLSRRGIRQQAARAGLVVDRQETTWTWWSPNGPVKVGVPRFGDCITVLRREGPRARSG